MNEGTLLKYSFAQYAKFQFVGAPQLYRIPLKTHAMRGLLVIYE